MEKIEPVSLCNFRPANWEVMVMLVDDRVLKFSLVSDQTGEKICKELSNGAPMMLNDGGIDFMHCFNPSRIECVRLLWLSYVDKEQKK